MAIDTKIEWADSTFNPWIGCTKIASGCAHCYAEAQAGRFGVKWGPDGTRRKTSVAYWRKPLSWNRKPCRCDSCGQWISDIDDPPHRDADGNECFGAPTNQRRRVFPSLCDPFEEWGGEIVDHEGNRLLVCERCRKTARNKKGHGPVPCACMSPWKPMTMADLRADFFRLIDQTPYLDWLLLTKRPQNIREMMAPWLHDRCGPESPAQSMLPIPNLWLLYSASDQESLEAGLPLDCADLVPVIGLSLEPLLGPIDLDAAWRKYRGDGYKLNRNQYASECTTRGIDWVIVGGESGSKARPCNIEWIRSIRDQCREAGVPCFIKQIGANYCDAVNGVCGAKTLWPYDVLPNGPSRRLKHPKGGDPAEWPEDIRVQEYPI